MAYTRDQWNAYMRAWRAKDPERTRRYKWKYAGIPTPPYQAPELCELCGLSSTQSLCPDHCHDTGVFRGWICAKCNKGLGLFGDCLEGLQRAVVYLTAFRERSSLTGNNEIPRSLRADTKPLGELSNLC